MAKDTVSLRLIGDVPLPQFAEALHNFDGLLKALSDEVIGANEIDWEVTQLRSGSATTVVRGGRAEASKVEKVVRAYEVVGDALAHGGIIPYSDEVARHAFAIAASVNGHIKAVEFVTDEHTASIDKPLAREEHDKRKQYSIGTISGVVHAIWDRPRIRLGLYEPLFDRIIYCYLDDSQEELARQVWRSRVQVTGMIFRDPDTDRPIEVRRVRSIELAESAPPGSYKLAKGVLGWQEGDEPAEVTIRRIRDAI